MFENIGGKIKSLAVIFCTLCIVAAVIFGFLLIVSALVDGNFGFIFLGLLVMGGGSVAAWIGSFFTYGFGELIEKATVIAENTKSTAQVESNREDQYQTLENEKKSSF